MKKTYLILALCLFVGILLNACTTHVPESTSPSVDLESLNYTTYQKYHSLQVGMMRKEVNEILKEFQLVKYTKYVFYQHEDEYVIVECDNEKIAAISTLKSFIPDNNDFTKVKLGMDIYEVISIIGLPVETVGFGLVSLHFANDEVVYCIQFDNQSKVLYLTQEQ